ncbi:hypothetical protein J1605_002800 [Eschrichtius robustus]|uniref:Gamma-butyrobetaine hydroxylase-like N-terminal domain-containing protein n=1 Tax=Eschrichtius robustus TaxID=9764 RepID=A0AB34HV52_ESCRO|nr:hypothetical protein J1605_002800 [Eschrichtius robustus]
MHCAIQKAEALDGAHLMRILWQDGAESVYPAVWLRDNCQCPDCYLDSAKARKLLIEALDVNIGIKGLTFDRKKVHITWPNDHYSEYEAGWLKKRCFSQQAREKLQRELFLPGYDVVPFLFKHSPVLSRASFLHSLNLNILTTDNVLL